MDSIKEFRLQIGLHQDVLADWLEISRSAVSLAELGQRTLSGPAEIRLSHFKQVLEKSKSGDYDFSKFPLPFTTFPKRQRELSLRLKKCEKLLANAEFKLSQSLEKIEVWQTAIIFCALLKMETFLLENVHVLDAIDRFQEKIILQYLEHGTFEINELNFSIQQIKNEIEYLRPLLNPKT